jgi:RND family efflux transporter MFP subunit
VTLNGRLDAATTVELRAQAGGRIDKVLCRPGQKVRKGAALFQIDPSTYQLEVKKAQAEVRRAQARVKRVASDRSRTLENAKKGFAGQSAVDKVDGDLAEAEAMLQAAEAALDVAMLSLNATTVTAPIDGTLAGQLPAGGNVVAANTTPLGTILALDKLYVLFDIPERTALRLIRLNRENKRLGTSDPAQTVMVALADESGFPHRATADFVDVRFDPASQTVSCRAVLSNPDDSLYHPGMSAHVKLFTSLPYKALTLAAGTLTHGVGEGYGVYVVNDQNFVEERRGVFQPVDGGLWAVVSGLKPDEWVVIGDLDGGTRSGQTRVDVERLSAHVPGIGTDEKPATP